MDNLIERFSSAWAEFIFETYSGGDRIMAGYTGFDFGNVTPASAKVYEKRLLAWLAAAHPRSVTRRGRTYIRIYGA